jgi:hypothetical protein
VHLGNEQFASFIAAKSAAAVHFDAEWKSSYRAITRRQMQEAEASFVGTDPRDDKTGEVTAFSPKYKEPKPRRSRNLAQLSNLAYSLLFRYGLS